MSYCTRAFPCVRALSVRTGRDCILYFNNSLIHKTIYIMATQTIDATLFASSHPDIAKRTSVSGLIISLVMMVVGILIFVSIFEMNDKSSTISMGLMVLGTALIL